MSSKFSSLLNQYFGPLSRDYCVYFYTLSIIFGIMFVVTLISILVFVFTNMKKVNTMFIINSLFMLMNSFLAYIANRLLHTMCVKSL
jgi:hypothetical protein